MLCRVIDAATVEELVVATSATIEQMVIRHSNLSSFPTSVLGLETAVTTLYGCSALVDVVDGRFGD